MGRAAAGVAAASLIPWDTAWATGGRKPNIVFVLADDWGWGDLSCYGHQVLKTPNIDKLASQGVLFSQFYVTSPVCSPSRAGIMTGQFPSRNRIFGHLDRNEENKRRDMPNWLDPNVTTITDLMKGAGYATGHFGKWHLGGGAAPGFAADAPEAKEYGVEDYRVYVGNGPQITDLGPNFPANSSEYIVNETIRFITENKDKPFYVNVWLSDVHSYLNPTEEQMEPYKDWGGVLKVYWGAAHNADKQLGRLFDKLDELGIANNTIVIFTSDNGPEIIDWPGVSHSSAGSTGPLRGRKRSLYEGGIRTPFIIRWPEQTLDGKVDNTTILSGADMLPSLCAMAGISVPKSLKPDGEDMSTALRGKPQDRKKPLMWDWRYEIYGSHLNLSPMLAIREGKWKLLANPDKSRVELYNIAADPSEVDNLADRHPDIAKRLTKEVLAWYAALPKSMVEKAAGKNDYPWPKGK